MYDSLDNNIGGVSQQQGGDSSLTFSSQFGTIAVNTLPIVSGASMQVQKHKNFMQGKRKITDVFTSASRAGILTAVFNIRNCNDSTQYHRTPTAMA